MKILAVGDMHLGRMPSRLPPQLHAPDLGPAEAWRRTVAAALDHGVKAVLLAGDVVDRDDDFFEAYRALEIGVKTLADAGIAVVGVAGNHDVKVLPRLVRHIPKFRLLGEGGRWESCRIDGGRDAVTLWGWSFPQARVLESPLEGGRPDPAPGINLGLLHCDRDAGPDSPYAPVTRRALERTGLDGWLLGHIHRPDALTAASPNGYLGSLTGLDRGESGPRGPWMLTVADGRITEVEHLPLAPLRWEALEVDLEGIGEPFQARERLLAAVRGLDGRMASLPTAPNAVGCRSPSPGARASGTPLSTSSPPTTGTRPIPVRPGHATSSCAPAWTPGPRSISRIWRSAGIRWVCWPRASCGSTARKGTPSATAWSTRPGRPCATSPRSPSGATWRTAARPRSR